MKLVASILALAIGTISCDGTTEVVIEHQHQVSGQGSVLHSIQTSNRPHRGVRRYEVHGEVRGAQHALSYIEEVADDGKGCFRIRPVEVTSNLVDTFLYRGMLEERQAFMRRYRDVELRNLELVFENYEVSDLGIDEDVAGRACELLSIVSRDGERRYELAVDTESAMVLRYAEIDSDGLITRSMEYLELDLEADLSDLDCFENTITEREFSDGDDLGYEPWDPRVLPDGYRELETSRISGPLGGQWLKKTYTDGIEALFLLQREATQKKTAGAAIAQVADEVMVYTEGLLTVLQGKIAGREVIAVGRASADELLSFLDSGKP